MSDNISGFVKKLIPNIGIAIIVPIIKVKSNDKNIINKLNMTFAKGERFENIPKNIILLVFVI